MHTTPKQAASSSKTAARKLRVRAREKEDERIDSAIAEPGTPEWFVAWAGLAAVSGDEDREAYDEQSGEVWQYMGGERRKGGRWRHVFRHRCHPRTKEWTYLRVPASPDWDPTPDSH